MRFERYLNHPVEKVWAALTEPERLIEWLAAAPTLKLRTGGAIELRWQNTDPDGNQAIAVGTITAYDPPAVIEYDTDIHGLIRWELAGEGAGCLLKLTVRHALPNEYIAMVLAGWHVHLDFLEDALDGKPVDWPNWPLDRWQALHVHYSAMPH